MSSGSYSGLAIHEPVHLYEKASVMAPNASSNLKAEQYAMSLDMEQLRGLPKSSVVERNVCSRALCNAGGVAQWLASLSLRPCGFRDIALGWYRARRSRRSCVKSFVRGRCEWALYSQVYLSGEISVGEMIRPDGVWTPIMSLPIWFHGDVGGTRDV